MTIKEKLIDLVDLYTHEDCYTESYRDTDHGRFYLYDEVKKIFQDEGRDESTYSIEIVVTNESYGDNFAALCVSWVNLNGYVFTGLETYNIDICW